MIVLEMADHGFDGGATAHLATDGFGDPADLAADPDLEAVGKGVTAIALVAVDAADSNPCKPFEIGDDGPARMAGVRAAMQGFGMQHGLPPFVRGSRCCDRDLAAELGS